MKKINLAQKMTIILATVLILFNFIGVAPVNAVRVSATDDVGGGNSEISTEDYNNLTEDQQFEYRLRKLGYKESDITILKYWYDQKTPGVNNNPAVVANKDENGDITLITFNLTEGQKGALSEELVNDTLKLNNKSSSSSDENALYDPEAKDEGFDIGGLLLNPIKGLLTTLMDGIYKVIQTTLIGTKATDLAWWKGDHIYLPKNMAATDGDDDTYFVVKNGDLPNEDSAVHIQYDQINEIPTMVVTPSAIFEGKIAALNGNFFNVSDVENQYGGEERSTAVALRETIGGWYIILRNIAIVGLLSVLVYIGIRIVISSSTSDKAKYKQFFMDWVIALCLIFFMHYIMSFMMTLTDAITDMLGSANSGNAAGEVLVGFGEGNKYNGKYMYTTFAGVARMRVQYDDVMTGLGYLVLYTAFVLYTAYFAVIYIKRILYLAFFTMIAPVVALTYPLDKVRDGKAQAFNFWFKEYTFYSLLQPLHLLLYLVLVQSAIQLASKNMIYSVVAMAFIVPAEKIVKSMFGIKSQTESGISGFVGASVAAHAFERFMHKPPKGAKGAPGASGADKKPKILSNSDATKEMAAFDIPDVGDDSARALNSGVGPQNRTGSVEGNGQAKNTSNNKGDAIDADYTVLDAKTQQEELMRRKLEEQKKQQKAGEENQDNNNNNQASAFDRAKNTFNETKRKIAGTNLGKWAGRKYTAAGGAGGIAKKALKAYGTAAGAIGLGAIGLGAGIVGGDMSDTWKGLAAGTSVGAYLGGNLGKRAGNAVSNAAQGRSKVKNFANEMNYGYEASQKMQEQSAYANDSANIQRIMADHEDFDRNAAKDYAKQEYEMMYNSKTKDVDLADKAIDLKDYYMKNGLDEQHANKKATAILNATKYYGRDTFTSDKKLKEAKNSMIERVKSQKNMTDEQARKAVDSHFKDIARLHGVEKMK